ncbi:hypothetical protein HanHA89_Chr17g0725281 [Helianthus annuus]|nr:hypothetical protein HanHA89_Chr17g0725281 [Helianthus annuus]
MSINSFAPFSLILFRTSSIFPVSFTFSNLTKANLLTPLSNFFGINTSFRLPKA